MSEEFNAGGMRPKVGSQHILLPVTFDYSGGRRDSNKSMIMWSVIIGVIGTIISIGLIFNDEGFFLTNLIIGLASLYLTFLIIRFVFLKEGRIRREQIELEDEDYRCEEGNLWGIFNIDPQYPHYCRFRNGKSGLFVRLNKDVILGKYSQSQFEHYEAIADALNIAGASRVQICHVDYMDNVGSDDRLEESFVELNEVSNLDVKDALTDMFTYLQEQMMHRVTTFDVYLFLWTGSDISAWNTIQRILSCFLEANYRSYHILNKEDLRELPMVLFNLEDFSVVGATSNAFKVNNYGGVIPISKTDKHGNTTVFNKTIEEKQEEARQRTKEEELRRQEQKRRKVGKKSNKNEKEIDLF